MKKRTFYHKITVKGEGLVIYVSQPSNNIRLTTYPYSSQAMSVVRRTYFVLRSNRYTLYESRYTSSLEKSIEIIKVWAIPVSLATTPGIVVYFLFHRVLRCFSSHGSRLMSYEFRQGWLDITLAGFPHSDIRGSKLVRQLPAAYRSLLRPSSVYCVKASFVCAWVTFYDMYLSRVYFRKVKDVYLVVKKLESEEV